MTEKPKIVVLGGGFGGAYCAQALTRRLRGIDIDVLLLDRNNYFVFYPFLIEAGTGSLAARHAVISIRSFLGEAAFRMAEVLGINPDDQTVTCRLPDHSETHALRYDQLVIALGSVTRLPDVPGLREHGFGLKGLSC